MPIFVILLKNNYQQADYFLMILTHYVIPAYQQGRAGIQTPI
jgi:hypothetical protein